jgi:DNA-binding transcriptional ArsR family regulator
MTAEEYNNLLTEEVRDIIKSLSDDKRLAIMIDLLLQPEGKTFTQLKEDIGIPQGTLNYHLKNLFENGLIINKFLKVNNTREYSYYLPSRMGATFFEKALDFIEEPLKYHTIDIQRPVASLPSQRVLDSTTSPQENIQMNTIAI